MTRGQDTEARLKRWRQGNCPIHGLGLATPPGQIIAPPKKTPVKGQVAAPMSTPVRCPHEECDFEAAAWPSSKEHFGLLGWQHGPEDIKAMLLKANEISADSTEPGRSARPVRLSWPLEDPDLV